jgi:acyl-CoA synthetase (NDP forming)
VLVAATPADAAPRVVEEAGQAGAKAAIVVSGGFAEVGRRVLGEGLVKSARRHGVRVLGPNCIGVDNAFNGLDTCFCRRRRPGGRPRAPLRFSAP